MEREVITAIKDGFEYTLIHRDDLNQSWVHRKKVNPNTGKGWQRIRDEMNFFGPKHRAESALHWLRLPKKLK